MRSVLGSAEEGSVQVGMIATDIEMFIHAYIYQ